MRDVDRYQYFNNTEILTFLCIRYFHSRNEFLNLHELLSFFFHPFLYIKSIFQMNEWIIFDIHQTASNFPASACDCMKNYLCLFIRLSFDGKKVRFKVFKRKKFPQTFHKKWYIHTSNISQRLSIAPLLAEWTRHEAWNMSIFVLKQDKKSC